MNSTLFYTGTFFIYLLVVFLELVAIISKKDPIHKIAMNLLLVAFLFQSPGVIIRGIQINFIPLTSTYEAVTFIGWIGALIVYLFYKIKKIDSIVAFFSTVTLTALYAISSSPIASSEAKPPIPALQSYWLVLHVSFAFIGEVFFILSFAAAIAYFIVKSEAKKERMDELMYRSILIGFPFFTLGALVFGAIWAKYAWGRFWAWDPKETWSLITWLIYSAFLHSRYMMKWKGKRSAIIAIIAFCVMIFTFFGVNFLLSGLHSYG